MALLSPMPPKRHANTSGEGASGWRAVKAAVAAIVGTMTVFREGRRSESRVAKGVASTIKTTLAVSIVPTLALPSNRRQRGGHARGLSVTRRAPLALPSFNREAACSPLSEQRLRWAGAVHVATQPRREGQPARLRCEG
eukprot:3300079-Prymnesium_polylepis.1